MSKSIYAGALIAIVAIVGAVFWFSGNTGVNARSELAAMSTAAMPPLANAVPSGSMKPEAPPSAVNPYSSSAPASVTKSVVSAASLLDKLGPMPEPVAVLADPDRWINAAMNGNAQAGFAMFFTVENCLKRGEDVRPTNLVAPQTSSDCGNLTKKEADDRLQWLKPAADKGSPIAQFMYGSAALRSDQYYRSRPDPTGRIDDINQHALGYLESAASYGIEEAFVLLSEVYLKGTFGQTDIPKSYAYLRAVADRSGNANYASLADRLGSQLRSYELTVGSRLATDLKSKAR